MALPVALQLYAARVRDVMETLLEASTCSQHAGVSGTASRPAAPPLGGLDG